MKLLKSALLLVCMSLSAVVGTAQTRFSAPSVDPEGGPLEIRNVFITPLKD